MDFLPPENNAMSNLLAIIKDPKSAQKRLDDINKAQADLNAKVEQAQQASNEAIQARADAEKALKEQQDLKVQNEAITQDLHKKLQDQIDYYSKALQDTNDSLSKKMKELNDQQQIQSQKEIELFNREAAVTSREDVVSVREAEAQALQTEYGTRISKLKTIME